MIRFILKREFFIAKGGERLCFSHPEDEKKVIKVKYKTIKGRDRNIIDGLYYSHLTKKKVDFSHITRFYGKVDTDKGLGLIFDKIENYDNSPIITFIDAIKCGILDYVKAEKLLKDLYFNFKKNKIVFSDKNFDNILCRKNSDNSFQLVIVDGLGTRYTGFKLWLSMNCSLYARYKIHKQFVYLFDNFKKEFASLKEK